MSETTIQPTGASSISPKVWECDQCGAEGTEEGLLLSHTCAPTTPTTAPVGEEQKIERQHTPTPWYAVIDWKETRISPEDGRFRLATLESDNHDVDAAFILKAVNTHAPLLARVLELEAALRGLLDCETNLNGCSGIKLLDAVDAARAALAGKVVG